MAGGRLAAVGFMVLGLAGTLTGPGPDPDAADYTALWIVVFIAVAFSIRVARMRTEVTAAGVDVFGLLSTRRVAWQQIYDVVLGYSGLRLITSEGDTVSCGPGKSNWSRLAATPTIADEWLIVMKAELAKRRGLSRHSS